MGIARMDKVRFGRALGYGARHAAKTLASAVDAATTPSTETAKNPAKHIPAVRQAEQISRSAAAAGTHAKGIFGTFWGNLKRISGVLWLQVTGVFFAVFALFLGQGVWRLRADFKSSPSTPGAQKLYFYLAVFLVFAYFTISSFVRASRKEAQSRKGHTK